MNLQQSLLLKTLDEKVIDVSDLENLPLTVDSISILDVLNKLCEGKRAYRVGVNEYVSRSYIWNSILDTIKKENSLDNFFISYRYALNEDLLSNMLAAMEQEGLIIKNENGIYEAVLDKLLSKEKIVKFFLHRVDKISIENVLNHFGFKSFVSVHGTQIHSAAFDHCQKLVDDLCAEGILRKNPKSNTFSWGDI